MYIIIERHLKCYIIIIYVVVCIDSREGIMRFESLPIRKLIDVIKTVVKMSWLNLRHSTKVLVMQELIRLTIADIQQQLISRVQQNKESERSDI